MADIGSLIVKIGADASGLQKAFSDLGGSAKQFQRGLETVGKIASTAFLAAASSAVAMTIAAGKQAEELQQLSGVTGINTDKLQEYDVMLNRAGLSGQDLALVMKQVSTSLDQARQGTGTAGDRFRQLGIDIKTVTSTDDLIKKIAVASGTFADGLQKSAVMSDLLGRSWQTVIKTFQGGAQSFEEMKAASAALGQTLSSSQVAVLAKMDDQIDDLMTAFKRFGQQLGVFMAPSVELVTNALKDLLVWGSNAFEGLSLGTDIFAIRLTHLALQASEVAATLFSSQAFSGEAWTQTISNLRLIGEEQDKLIAKARAAAAVARVPAAADTRKALPEMIDTSKIAAQQQALIDAQLKADQDLFRQKGTVAQAYYDQQQAMIASNQARGIASDIETADAQMQLLTVLNTFKETSLNMELANYQKFVSAKSALFTADQKGQADRAKFEVEAASKTIALQEQIRISGIKSVTDRIASEQKLFEVQQKHTLDSLEAETILADATMRQQEMLFQQEFSFIGAAEAARQVGFEAAARRYDLELAQLNQSLDLKLMSQETYNAKVTALEQDADTKRRAIVQQFPTFFEQQMRAVVNSNVFSVSQIITTWTGGLANAIVNGGNFIKAAWESTQLALVQGVINTGVQMAAQWALQAATEAGIVTQAAAQRILGHTAAEEAKTAVTTAQEATRVGIVLASGKAMGAVNAATIAGITTAGIAALGVMQAVLEGIVAFMSAVASSVAAVPIVGQVLAGTLIAGAAIAQFAGQAAIAAATAAIAATGAAAAGTMAFAKGGIVTGPTMGLMGEAGPEANIPLNSRGAAFMQEAFGMGKGEGQIIHTHVYLKGREIALAVSDDLPSTWRTMGTY